jgi:hypothetical protein
MISEPSEALGVDEIADRQHLVVGELEGGDRIGATRRADQAHARVTVDQRLSVRDRGSYCSQGRALRH